MKYDFSQPLKDLDGEVLKDGPEELTLRAACHRGLMALNESEKNMTGMEKWKRYKLAEKIHKDGQVEITSEEVTTLKQVVGLLFSAAVVGPVYDILEAPEEAKKNEDKTE